MDTDAHGFFKAQNPRPRPRKNQADNSAKRGKIKLRMKTTAKRFKFWLPVQFFILLAFSFPRPSVAQGYLNALTTDSGGTVVGYASQGVGWSFVPTADLLVTGISSTAPQVDFWLGTNQNIASYTYAGPFGGPPTFAAPSNFQAVASLLLSAGQTYFISTQQPNFSSPVNTLVYSLNPSSSPYDPITFSLSPYITQFASYYLSSSGQWSSTTTPASDNANYVVLGPNFQFQIVPEPPSFNLSLLILVVWLFRRLTVSNYIHDRKAL